MIETDLDEYDLNVSSSCISHIVNGRVWKHIGGNVC
jgi:hypothetical protein